MARKGMSAYTAWAIRYPWHVGGSMQGKYPKDSKGYCTCKCTYCKSRKHKATLTGHGSF